MLTWLVPSSLLDCSCGRRQSGEQRQLLEGSRCRVNCQDWRRSRAALRWEKGGILGVLGSPEDRGLYTRKTAMVLQAASIYLGAWDGFSASTTPFLQRRTLTIRYWPSNADRVDDRLRQRRPTTNSARGLSASATRLGSIVVVQR